MSSDEKWVEIFDFLQQTHPLSKLDEDTLKNLANTIEISYVPRDEVVLQPDNTNEWLYLIRTGSVQRTDHEDGLVAQFGAGDFFGHKAISRGGMIKNKVSCMEDSLFYMIPESTFQSLMQAEPSFKDYFSQQKNQRLKSAFVWTKNNAFDIGEDKTKQAFSFKRTNHTILEARRKSLKQSSFGH